MEEYSLLPAPRRVEWLPGQLSLRADRLILLDADRPADLRGAAGRVQQALHRCYNWHWDVVAGTAVPAAEVALRFHLDRGLDDPLPGDQAYRLVIAGDGITVSSPGLAGLYYGACTLAQMLQQTAQEPDGHRALRCVRITDWPDFPVRGAMLDISRNKVPTMDTLYALIDMLAGWKINQLQLYTEHTFAYRNHPEVWAAASPMTGEEILDLDAFCRDRYVELVPNQNSFGHMERWLRHPRYSHLAEIDGEIETPWGHFRGPFSLCPVDPRSLDLLRGLYDELLPHFTSRQFNVGCDETWDLGQGRSRSACLAAGGARQVYLKFIEDVQAEVQARGRSMQFWADIVMQRPDAIPASLRDSTALEWGYEAGHPFARHSEQLAEAGMPFYVCPGTSSWCSIAGRTDNALANLRAAAAGGREHGAAGYLVTDWGDAGHWQALPVSYLGFAAGAAYSWALESNDQVDMALATGRHAFQDPYGIAGQVAYDLGNVYQAVGYMPDNGSALFHILHDPIEQLRRHKVYGHLGLEAIDCAEKAIEEAISPLAKTHLERDDAGLICREFEVTAHLLRHACSRARLVVAGDDGHGGHRRRALAADLDEVAAELRSTWLARNRPGGLDESLTRLERAGLDYCDA